MGITLAVFSIEGKRPEEKKISNNWESWLKMSFLSNFNILAGMLLGPTDLLESNEDMTFSISVLSVRLTKKEIWDLFFRKSEKWNIKLSFSSNQRKIVVENIWDFQWIGYSGTINSKGLRDISRNVFNI